MAQPDGGGVESLSPADLEAMARLEERRAVRREIGARMYQLTYPEMLGADLELSAMVKWLAEYSGTNPQARALLTPHAHRMIAFRLGPFTTRESIEDIESAIGAEETDKVMAEIEKLADYADYVNASDETIAYWDPVVDDVGFVIDAVMDYTLVQDLLEAQTGQL